MYGMNKKRAVAVGHGREDERILALFGTGDGGEDAIETALRSAGLVVERCEQMQQLCEAAEREPGGALLVSEPYLRADGEQLATMLKRQPAWSDLPVIVIASADAPRGAANDGQRLLEHFDQPETVFYVQSPVRRDILLLAAKSALAARRTQYEVRDLQQQRDLAERALREAEEQLASALQDDEAGHSHHRQQFHQAERTASMGTLAAGLGHDLGNLVFPLRIRVDLMRSRDTCPELQDDLKAIHNAVQYLQRLANGLRHMAMDPGETGIGMESVDLNEWWTDVEPVLRNALGRGVKLEQRFDKDLPRIPVAAHSLTQAVFNLVQNSSEAMRQRGSGRVTISADHDGNTVRLTVADDGPGMSEAVRRRCLEPFFTTKVRGISTGLGLALAHGVVKRAGGTIELSSEIGSGTAWTLVFPTNSSDASAARTDVPQRAAVGLSDPRLGAFVAAMLRTLNFETVGLNGSTEPPSDADVWVTDKQDGMPPAAVQFVDAKPSRFVVLLGLQEPSEHPRILHSNGLTTSEAIRKVLRELVLARTAQEKA